MFSIIFVSLFAAGAVSATDDVADAIAVSDIDDSSAVSIDNEVEAVSLDANDSSAVSQDNEVEAVSVEDSKIISEDNEVETVGTNVIDQDNIVKEGNGFIFNISGLLDGTGIKFGDGNSIDLSELLNRSGISFSDGSTIDLSGLLKGTTVDLSDFLKLDDLKIFDLLNNSGITFKNGNLDLTNLLMNITGMSFKDNTLDISTFLKDTGINSSDIFSLLNGTGITFNGSSIDFSNILDGTGITFNGTSANFSALLGLFGADYENMDLSDIMSEIGLRNATVADLLDLLDINVSSIDLSGLLKGVKINISDLLNGTGISFNEGSIDLSGLLNGTGINFNASSIDLSSLLNGIGFSFNASSIDLFGLLNGTGFSFNASSIDLSKLLDFIANKTKQNSTTEDIKKDSITSSNLNKYYTRTTIFRVTVKNGDVPLTKGNVIFTINNREYIGHIGSNGVASLSLKNLRPGKYIIFTEYGQTVVKNTIVVKKVIFTKNVSKKYKRAGRFTVKILNSKGKAYAKQTVAIKFKGKTYKVRTNSKGIASFNIPKNLKIGKYSIRTTYAGLTVSNIITVRR